MQLIFLPFPPLFQNNKEQRGEREKVHDICKVSFFFLGSYV